MKERQENWDTGSTIEVHSEAEEKRDEHKMQAKAVKLHSTQTLKHSAPCVYLAPLVPSKGAVWLLQP